jgi:hypothetical protein
MLTDNDVEVRLSELRTPKGERLEIASEEGSIALDAVALETFAWQSAGDIGTRLDDVRSASNSKDGDKGERLTVISNEFGYVVVSEGGTEHRPWIGFSAEKQGESIRLSPSELAAVSRLDVDTVTEWIAADLRE